MVLAPALGLCPSELLPHIFPEVSCSAVFASFLFYFFFVFCTPRKRTFPQSIVFLGIAQERKVAPASVYGLNIPVCGPFLAPKQPSSFKPAAHLRHGVFPAEGKPRESGSQLPAPSRQNHIRASPASLRTSREQSAPPQTGGEERLREKEETSTSFTG